MKRPYVSPEARGHHLGIALIEARVEAAPAMGLNMPKADTWNNQPMLALCERPGFHDVELYADSATQAHSARRAVYGVSEELWTPDRSQGPIWSE